MTLKTSQEQAAIVHEMVHSLCCNYDDGYCLILDNFCPQMFCESGICCKYYTAAVLPENVDLCGQISGQRNI